MPPSDDSTTDTQADLHRIAAVAALEAARALSQMGFSAQAEGANIIARQGKTTWRVTNRVRFQPGIRQQVLHQLSADIISALVNRLPTKAH